MRGRKSNERGAREKGTGIRLETPGEPTTHETVRGYPGDEGQTLDQNEGENDESRRSSATDPVAGKSFQALRYSIDDEWAELVKVPPIR